MAAELVALLGDGQAGRVRRDRRGRLSFLYDEDWRNARHALPLSISMPLAASRRRVSSTAMPRTSTSA